MSQMRTDKGGRHQGRKMITITYLDVTQKDIEAELLAAGYKLKDKVRPIKEEALAILDVEHTEDTLLHSWLKHLSERNNIPYTLPVDSRITDAIVENAAACRFMWWLA